MSELICDFGILRELRKRDRMSIAGLSEKSGVSASVISKLERNQSNGEMETLYRIARAFNMTLSDLISLAENRTSQVAHAVQYRSGDFRFERVSYAKVRCMRAVAPAGAKLSAPELHQDDYELCWVLRGRVRFTLPNEKRELSGGMSILFDALLEHTFEVLEDAEIIITHIRKGKRF